MASQFSTAVYSLKDHTVTIGTETIGGHPSGDGLIEVTWEDSGQNTITPVRKGHSVLNLKEQKDCMVSIKLNVTSPSNDYLYGLSTNAGKNQTFGGTITSPTGRTLVSWDSDRGVMQGLPVESIGEEAYDLQYVILVTSAQPF